MIPWSLVFEEKLRPNEVANAIAGIDYSVFDIDIDKGGV